MAALLLVPSLSGSPEVISLVPTLVVAMLATLHVWLMLRVELLSFASPPFMALGGYATALLALHVSPNALLVTPLAFVAPALIAAALGVLVLRLRGTYFALITFAFAQIVVIALALNQSVLGGNTGLVSIPALTLGSREFAADAELLRFSVVVGVIGVVIASAVSISQRRAFAAIHENEPLAASLGLRPWLYKTIAFVTSAGLAGLAGLVVINQLAIAQPNTFTPFSSVGHVAGAVLGGTASIFGALLGGALFAWIDHEFAGQAEYSQLLLGVALIVVVLAAKDGISGLVVRLTRLASRRERRPVPSRDQRLAALRSGATAEEVAPEPGPGLGHSLEVRELSRRFGGLKAVDGLSFRLAPGEVLGVIGPNGAGKTTLVSMLAGAVEPSAGVIALDGADVAGRPTHSVARRGVARTFQQTATFPGETVAENLLRALAFSGQPAFEPEAVELIRSTGLADRLDERTGDLPYGLQKMLGLLMAIVTRPKLLLLDEPAAGLERSERPFIDRLVQYAVARNCAVLLVEHDMDLVRRVCPRVIVMDAGALLAEGAPDVLFSDPAVIAAYLGEVPEAVAP
jgi:ABC-type branched-subunit amino acid transport system ATPase component/ABC-type branched-subunit amino acid transport system permease subunit